MTSHRESDRRSAASAGVQPLTIRVNRELHEIEVDTRTPLLWVLRDHLGLTGTKYGCGISACGACTVFLDRSLVRACSVAVRDVGKANVTTVERIGEHPVGKAVQAAWIAEQAPQCGYCQSGQVMSATALLLAIPSPTDADIDAALAGNLCRCGTYGRIRRAVHRAARALTG